MYQSKSNRPSDRCVDPNWQQIYTDREEEYKIIINLKNALIAFIKIISMHKKPNPIAELLGTIEIDLIQRTEQLDEISKHLE